MQVYHLIFSHSKIISCYTISAPAVFNGNVTTTVIGDILVSAYIRAASEAQALQMGRQLLQQHHATTSSSSFA